MMNIPTEWDPPPAHCLVLDSVDFPVPMGIELVTRLVSVRYWSWLGRLGDNDPRGLSTAVRDRQTD